MWSAIILLWLSLLWTLLCLLLYRDRTVVLEASLPAWIASLVLWLMLWSPVSVFRIGRWWSGKRGPGAAKKAPPRRGDAAKRAAPRRKKG